MQRKTAPCNHSVCHKCVRRSTVDSLKSTENEAKEDRNTESTAVRHRGRGEEASEVGYNAFVKPGDYIENDCYRYPDRHLRRALPGAKEGGDSAGAGCRGSAELPRSQRRPNCPRTDGVSVHS